MYKLFLTLTLMLWANSLLKANQPVFVNDGQSPMISEFMASNQSSNRDNKGNYSDWIEIYNPTTKPINLLGWYISDNVLKPLKWIVPEVIVLPGQYQLIYMSGENDLSDMANVHASFNLKSEGETLMLIKPDGVTKAWYFNGIYPQQYPNVSYGLVGAEYNYLYSPTPGAANKNDKYLPPLSFSQPHGYYNSSFPLEIKSADSDVSIYYTLNGSAPDSLKGAKYNAPITITKTSVVRAIAYKKGYKQATSVTSSYFFTKDIVKQPALPKGYPDEWGPYTAMTGNAVADYEMDPEICNDPAYAARIEEALKELPVVSVVTDMGYLFSSSTDSALGGIYYHTGAPITESNYQLGKDWDRPASVEYFEPDGSGFNIDCGIQLNGGHSRRSEKSPKHSFRLLFKNEYGPTRLDYDLFKEEDAVKSFNRLILRASYGITWIHFDTNQRKNAQYIFDCWSKDKFRGMGNVAAHNKFAHLYLNGLYWGLYNICERMDEDFVASYFKGGDTDFDIIKDYNDPVSGDLIAWRALHKSLNAEIAKTENYQKLIGNNVDGTPNAEYPKMVDPQNLIDYMLLNFYGGNSDWDHHNWVSFRNKVNPEGFKFLPWDTELIFGGLDDNTTNERNANCPSGVFQGLLQNSDFKMLLADRIYKHFFNNGPLTADRVVETYMKRADEIRNPLVCESARWGDYRRDAHPWSSSPFKLYTVDDWELALNDLLENYFPERTNVVIEQLKQAEYYPTAVPPVIDTTKTALMGGDKIAISSANAIYYTLDGTDPRLPGGTISPGAKLYSKKDSVTIQKNCLVVARVKVGAVWSAKVEANFTVEGNVSVNELASANGNLYFTAYPNPARNKVVFQFNNNLLSHGQIEVYSMMGQQMATLNIGNTNHAVGFVEYPTSDLAKGVYMCLLRSDKGFKTLKLVVSK